MKVDEILAALTAMFPDAHCELNHRNPFELAVAVVLSAQTTDVSVNKVTPRLFEKYPTPEALAEAPLEDIEDCIRRIGLYHNKAKSIQGLARGGSTVMRLRARFTASTACAATSRRTSNCARMPKRVNYSKKTGRSTPAPTIPHRLNICRKRRSAAVRLPTAVISKATWKTALSDGMSLSSAARLLKTASSCREPTSAKARSWIMSSSIKRRSSTMLKS